MKQEFTPDKWTKKLIDLLLDIAKIAQKENKKYYIGGGFSIYLTLGKILRNHEDIDFYPDKKDKQWWKNWFIKKGYKIIRGEWMNNYPDAYYLTNDKGEYFADVYPIKIFDNGSIGMLNKNGKYGVWEGKSWIEVKKVAFQKTSVFVENPKSVIEQKLEWSQRNKKPLSQKHEEDIEIYNKYVNTT